MKILTVLCVLVFVVVADLKAQDVDPASRAEQIENEQAAKQEILSPAVPSTLERNFNRIQNV